MQWVIFTDLDGTLLDFKDYSYAVAEPVVRQLQQQDIPLVFCSSKTRTEQEYYRNVLSNNSPFIVENGSAILIPKGYFSFNPVEVVGNQYPITEAGEYWVVMLGERSMYVREVVQRAREEVGIALWGYADLPLEEIMEITRLDQAFALRAATRDFSETILKGDTTGSAFAAFQAILKTHGLACVSGGKFYTVMGERSDKGTAVRVLTALYYRRFGRVHTMGLGDSANDMPLLEAVDTPFLVQKPNGEWLRTNNERVINVEGVGPQGWVNAVQSAIQMQ